MAAYRDGLTTAEGLKKVCKVDKAEFEKGYKEYLQTVVAEIGGRPVEKKRSLKVLKAEFEKDPGNADLAGELAESLLERGDRIEARNMAKKAIEKKSITPAAASFSRSSPGKRGIWRKRNDCWKTGSIERIHTFRSRPPWPSSITTRSNIPRRLTRWNSHTRPTRLTRNGSHNSRGFTHRPERATS